MVDRMKLHFWLFLTHFWPFLINCVKRYNFMKIYKNHEIHDSRNSRPRVRVAYALISRRAEGAQGFGIHESCLFSWFFMKSWIPDWRQLCCRLEIHELHTFVTLSQIHENMKIHEFMLFMNSRSSTELRSSDTTTSSHSVRKGWFTPPPP